LVDDLAHQDLEQDLRELVSLRIVHKTNMMSISELLNPQGEHGSGLETWTPEEIFQSIQERDSNEGLPQPEHTEVEVPPQPSYSDLLKSSEVVMAYLKHEECKEARACGKAIRQALQKFSAAQSKGMTQSNLNHYFSSKP
jgi:hypothetical protein